MRFAAVLVLFSVTRTALADPPPPLTPIPTGDDRISALKEGQAAPFAGQIFDAPTALRWANYLHQCKYRLGADVDFQKKLDDVDKKAVETVLALERQKYAEVTHDLEARLVEAVNAANHPPFYKEVWFGVTLGVIGSVGLMAATAAVLHATK